MADLRPAVAPAPGMSRIRPAQLVYSLLVIALFAPVFLPIGSAAFRPALLGFVAGIPAFPALVVILLVVFVGLSWFFSRTAFGDASRNEPQHDRIEVRP